MNKQPKKVINAVAPIRICDIGGWTDTWFAGYGNIFNIAVYPYVEVQVFITERTGENRVSINLENYQDRYSLDPDKIVYEKYPLIDAAVDLMDIPDELAFSVNIYSTVPPGASTGTSAAVSVALIGALDTLTPGRRTAHEVAALAHSVETEKLGLQSGIQDQLGSAYGGMNYIEMHRFPDASVSQIQVPNSIWWELENRLALVYIGSPHTSSDVHRQVIDDLENNPRADKTEDDPRLKELRRLAVQAKDAVYDGDFGLLGRTMTENTQAQRELHRKLVCGKFEEIIDIGRHFGCIGFKVNGAGGDGGSITLLTDGEMSKKRMLLQELERKEFNSLGIYLSRQGLRIW